MKNFFQALVVILSVGFHSAYAQLQAGLVLGLSIPVGDFSVYNPGLCFGTTGKYALNDKMTLGANLHFNSFRSSYYHDPYFYNDWRHKASITAFNGLFQYFLTEGKLKFYAGGDLGLYFWRSRTYYEWINPGGNHVYDYRSDTGVELGIAPTGGITYDITDKLVLDGSLKLNLMITNDLHYAGLNAGLFYKFGE